MTLRYEDPTPRRFYLVRNQDISGLSGVGKVASGCCWPDGACVLHWNTEVWSTTVFQNMDDLIRLHGHNGATEVVWVDGDPYE